jgi:hypothetical protein
MRKILLTLPILVLLICFLVSCTKSDSFKSTCNSVEGFIPKDAFILGGDGEKWNPRSDEKLGAVKLNDPAELPTDKQKDILIKFISTNMVGKPSIAYDEYIIPSTDVVSKADLEKYPIDINAAKVTAFYKAGIDSYLISIAKDNTQWIIFVSDDGIVRLSISSGTGLERIELPNKTLETGKVNPK